jgi:hypothetical protein
VCVRERKRDRERDCQTGLYEEEIVCVVEVFSCMYACMHVRLTITFNSSCGTTKP